MKHRVYHNNGFGDIIHGYTLLIPLNQKNAQQAKQG